MVLVEFISSFKPAQSVMDGVMDGVMDEHHHMTLGHSWPSNIPGL